MIVPVRPVTSTTSAVPTRIVDELCLIADELEQLDTRREQLYARRLELWLDGQARHMTQRELAAPSRVTDGAVTQALRKVRLAANGAT